MSKGLLLGLAAAGAAVWWVFLRGSWPAGHGPFDALPAGLGARTGPVRITAPTTGLIYDTYVWPTAAPTVTFNVAALASGQGWISFWQDASSGARSFVASYNQGVPGGPVLSTLQRDFNVT